MQRNWVLNSKKIALVIPSALKSFPKDTNYSFIYAHDYLLNRMNDLPFEINHLEIIAPTEFPIDAGRNMATAQLFEDGFDISVWFDADQTFPKNMIFRLLNNPEPIVTGMYYLKKPPFYPIVFKETHGTDFLWFKPIMEFPESDLFHADMVGMGCVKIDVKVFKDIQKHQKEGEYEFFRYGINPITIDVMKHETKKHVLKKAAIREKYIIRDVSEDVYFWKLVRQHTDYKIVVDPKIQCGHISDLEVTKDIFQSFYDGQLEHVRMKDEGEYKKIKELVCRAEAIKSAS
jgi:hypothetical protein